MSDFCRACGAGIPPRDGEGRCPICDPEGCAANAARHAVMKESAERAKQCLSSSGKKESK